MLYFFGGGFVLGSAAEDLSITARLASDTGLVVYAVQYRLAPEHPFPAAADDALAAYRALLAAGRRVCAVAGESAGGNLAYSVVLEALARGLQAPCCVVLLSPWVDLSCSGDTYATSEGLEPTMSTPCFLRPCARAYTAGSAPLDDPRVSPLFAEVPSGFPPTWISTGTRDLLLSDCARLATKLRLAGVAVQLQVAEGMWHVHEYYPETTEAAQSLDLVSRFVLEHTRDQT
eukprot:TRINITY_DN6918_c0_g1_i1.p2 TRINITY_DN6918_c0_g1~~TRINITY_DN6918_c0_g1_i1.p2  ORF type:complete len:231 (+),score=43.32 TRINITY_DN6918_c0_g1_i1:436-1128(+)